MGRKIPAVVRVLRDATETDTGCWLSGLRPHKTLGYPQVREDGVLRQASHVVYEAFVAPVVQGQQIGHSCGFRACVNPDHLVPVKPSSPIERTLAGMDVTDDGCWLPRRVATQTGYVMVWDHGRFRLTHRVMYEGLVGPIPDGMTLDHLCRNRACCNPEHLEPTTIRENTLRGEAASAINARKTHCLRGHAFDSANTYVWRGHRQCRACNAMRARKRSAA